MYTKAWQTMACTSNSPLWVGAVAPAQISEQGPCKCIALKCGAEELL